ncbi:MAG: protein translocase subunit SecD [Lachnospiraceae bacterium]|nr:protein translocase subunit SecD [Lachnospiraceae bacterium]
MKKNKAIVTLILALAILAGLCYYSVTIISSTGVGEDRSISLGLDLAGGVSITYQVVGDEPTDEQMSDTIYKLQKRVESYSTEAQVYKVGDDRISVEIPGVTDANKILEELGKPGTLEFQTDDGKAFMDGNAVAQAKAATITNETGNKENIVELTLTDEGAETFAKVTTENVGKYLPIVFDEEVISYPQVQNAITGGTAQITGMASFEEAEILASQIRIGSLSLKLEELRSEVVGAQLGEEAISTSLKAGAIGLILVMIFMIVQYLLPGAVAAVSLAIYTTLVVATLYLFEITLTLPGIAGIILSIGMAVDANVIIFARIREEIAAGKSVATAIENGFARARSAILDGNITTLIAAAVLGMRGSGTVKGFASTLAIGIILSMFTCMIVTKLLLQAVYAMGLQDEKLYGKAKKRKELNFVSKTGIFILISCLVIASGFVGMGVHKAQDGGILNYSLEFKGGTSTSVVMDKKYTIDEIDKKIVPFVEKVTGDGNVQAQAVEGTNQVVIKTRTLSLKEREKLNQTLKKNFDIDEKTITSESISSTVSNEMKNDAMIAVAIATVCMLIYIWFRFKDVRFAASAVIALGHDVLVVLTCYVLAWISVGNTFIACMLTIIGYSINDTIVIFDRIRETLKTNRNKTKEGYKEIVNKSINQTLSRSINTSITTFVMVLMLFILGVTSIREFSLPLMVGLLSGTYSSICIASEIWYLMRVRSLKKVAK